MRDYDVAMRPQTAVGLREELARDAIVRLCTAGLRPRELLGRVSARVEEIVPHAHAAWLLTDPATMLFTGAVAARDVNGPQRLQFIENELFAPDYAKFTEVVRQPVPVATLSAATGGHPERSARHRTLHRPNGLSGELRAGFTTGQACWGVACLARNEEDRDFTAEEVVFIGSLCPYIGHGLRTGLLLDEVEETRDEDAPGIVVLGANDAVESISQAADGWLAKLPDERFAEERAELPSALYAVAMQARSAATARHREVPRARVRTATGQWLVLQASRLRDQAGSDERVAVIIEPARRADLASIIVELYELTEREQHITQLLARGLAIDEIAHTLWISRHTVRDHVKSIFSKLRVSSRPELTAKLFAEQFLPSLEHGTPDPPA